MKAVFIVGTGRSGTHFTTRLMNGFENIRDPMAGKENNEILRDVARAAIHHRLPSKETENYYRERLENRKGIFLDQHHPNLFFVKHWSEIFDGLVFLYPQRPAHQIVASMLRHAGVMGWYRYAGEWRQRLINRIPYPNQFMGIDRYADIKQLPPHLLCAHRVLAHRRAYERLVSGAGGALRGIEYQSLVNDPLAELSRVFTTEELSALGTFTLVETPRKDSLSKYRDVLSDGQVAEIQEMERQAG